ncbi:MAG: AmmeMemoRadiSam system protein B [Campylobacterales bacterium]
MRRNSFFAGSFYPNSSSDIDALIREFDKFSKAEKTNKIKALIAPHAGYIFSGYSANEAYRSIEPAEFERVVIIGPSHHHYFEKISVGEFDSVETPYGDIEFDKQLANRLRSIEGVTFESEAHKEHSTETQFSFVKKYLPKAKIVEIVYGQADIESIKKCVNMVLDEAKTLLIISTDLSHFYTLDEAKRLDSICLEAVKHLEASKIQTGCEACGAPGIYALLSAAKQKDLKPKLLDYRTSADASGDTNRVVGYMSAVFEG